jgi:hypothetical protein
VTQVVSQQLRPVRYGWGPIRRLVVFAAAFGLIGASLTVTGAVASLAIRTGVLGAHLGVVWYGGVLPAEDRALAVAPAVLSEWLTRERASSA